MTEHQEVWVTQMKKGSTTTTMLDPEVTSLLRALLSTLRYLLMQDLGSAFFSDPSIFTRMLHTYN